MTKNIEIILSFRKQLLTKIGSVSAEQLNVIPKNFNNNIIWNLGHMNTVLQALCYRSSGLQIKMDEDDFKQFMSGTKLSDFITESEIKTIKDQLVKSPEELQSDLENGLFKTYNKVERIEKVYGINVETINDALDYVTFHDGIHYNAILTLKRVI